MPFAGQAVVERNLPFTCLMSNYLSSREGAMQGLVQHPFAAQLDEQLRSVDPEIPVPVESVVQVVDRIMAGRPSRHNSINDLDNAFHGHRNLGINRAQLLVQLSSERMLNQPLHRAFATR